MVSICASLAYWAYLLAVSCAHPYTRESVRREAAGDEPPPYLGLL
jgi:hypothetical protein